MVPMYWYVHIWSLCVYRKLPIREIKLDRVLSELGIDQQQVCTVVCLCIVVDVHTTYQTLYHCTNKNNMNIIIIKQYYLFTSQK